VPFDHQGQHAVNRMRQGGVNAPELGSVREAPRAGEDAHIRQPPSHVLSYWLA
jgi:hypothetical protein